MPALRLDSVGAGFFALCVLAEAKDEDEEDEEDEEEVDDEEVDKEEVEEGVAFSPDEAASTDTSNAPSRAPDSSSLAGIFLLLALFFLIPLSAV